MKSSFIFFKLSKNLRPGRLAVCCCCCVALAVALQVSRSWSAVLFALISVSLHGGAASTTTVWLRVGSCGIIFGTDGRSAFKPTLLIKASPSSGIVRSGPPDAGLTMNAGRGGKKFGNGPFLSPPLKVLLRLLLLLNVVDGSLSCVRSTGVILMPLRLGFDVEFELATAEVTPNDREIDIELAAPASLAAVLLALESALTPLDVVLLMLAEFPTPLKASLPEWLVAFWAAVLRLALLEVDDPSPACQYVSASCGHA